MIKKFKTTLFGYSKREVCEYISKVSDELAEKHNVKTKELEDKIQALREENARLADAKNEAEKRLAELEPVLAE